MRQGQVGWSSSPERSGAETKDVSRPPRRKEILVIKVCTLTCGFDTPFADASGYSTTEFTQIIFLLLSNTGLFSTILCGEKMDRSSVGVLPSINSAMYLPTA